MDFDVIILGAGPYGLSAAAHLQDAGISTQVFGEPMEFWEKKMPTGMVLRSPREASNISDPHLHMSLDAYESVSGSKFARLVPRETFVNYGRWFESQLGSSVDRRNVSNVSRNGSGFKSTLSDGTVLKSKRVVVATGIGMFRKNPELYAGLPASRVSHCYAGSDLASLGQRVAVIGGGQSALECAALLHEAGRDVDVISRNPQLHWVGIHKRLHRLGIVSRILYSKHDVGPLGISRLVSYPNLIYHFPLGVKDPLRKRAIRAAGSDWLIPRLKDVRITKGHSVASVKEIDGEIQLLLDNGKEIRVDHVLLGTGYNIDISKYGFLSEEIVKDVRRIDGSPDVEAGFSTSVLGLHFIGATAARKFGPLLCFVAGTEFASKELTRYMVKARARNGAH